MASYVLINSQWLQRTCSYLKLLWKRSQDSHPGHKLMRLVCYCYTTAHGRSPENRTQFHGLKVHCFSHLSLQPITTSLYPTISTCQLLVGLPGFEPGRGDSKSPMLPLHHRPITENPATRQDGLKGFPRNHGFYIDHPQLLVGTPRENRTLIPALKGPCTNHCTIGASLVRPLGFEPRTQRLKVSCSTNWAKGASSLSYHHSTNCQRPKRKNPGHLAWVTIKQLMLLQVTQSIHFLFVLIIVFSSVVPSSISI